MRFDGRRARRVSVLTLAIGALVVALMAPAWGCVAGAYIRIDRDLVAAGGELEVSITVAAGPTPPTLALRLDRLDAPPLLTLVPNPSSPTVVRVRLPHDTAAGQHVLIANDEPYPLPVERYGYLTTRAMFSVVDPALAAANPAVQTAFDFNPPVRYEDLRLQLYNMGARVLRIHHLAGGGGEVMGAPGELLNEFLGRAAPTLERGTVMIDSVTFKGQVEQTSLGPVGDRVSSRRVIGLPAPAPVAAVVAPEDDASAPRPLILVAIALVVALAGVLAAVRLRA